jgi:hypothetical protein
VSESRGIVVIGTPRSGTTLLRRLLDAHPRIACPGETGLFSACARFLKAETIAEGVEIGVLSGLGFAGFERAEVMDRLRRFAFEFPEAHAAAQGKARWAEKTAFDAFHLEAIERLCGDHVQYVCVTRHGLDVACSLKELSDKNQHHLEELHAYIRRWPKPLEAYARAWVDLTKAILKFAKGRSNAHVLRYEDLVQRPEETVAALFAFLGEAADVQALLGQALQRKSGVGLGDWKTYQKAQIDSSSLGRWRSLSDHTVGALARVVNPTLHRAGYETVAAAPVRSAAEASRRYELGLLVGGLSGSKSEK